jgi:hypothetical protein
MSNSQPVAKERIVQLPVAAHSEHAALVTIVRDIGLLGLALRLGYEAQPSTGNRPHARLRSQPRKDHRGVDLISDVLPFRRLWYGEPNAVSNAIGYAKFRSRSHDAVIRVYDEAGNVIETHEQAGEFREP